MPFRLPRPRDAPRRRSRQPPRRLRHPDLLVPLDGDLEHPGRGLRARAGSRSRAWAAGWRRSSPPRTPPPGRPARPEAVSPSGGPRRLRGAARRAAPLRPLRGRLRAPRRPLPETLGLRPRVRRRVRGLRGEPPRALRPRVRYLAEWADAEGGCIHRDVAELEVDYRVRLSAARAATVSRTVHLVAGRDGWRRTRYAPARRERLTRSLREGTARDPVLQCGDAAARRVPAGRPARADRGGARRTCAASPPSGASARCAGISGCASRKVILDLVEECRVRGYDMPPRPGLGVGGALHRRGRPLAPRRPRVEPTPDQASEALFAVQAETAGAASTSGCR